MCAYSVFNTFPVYPLSAKPLILLAFCRYRYHTSLFIDGGITYNGVWNQETLQGNRYHTMDDIKYIACDFVPDKSFVYCEANIRMDAESNNNGLLSIIKEYADNKLLRTEDGKGHTLQIELERNSRNTTGHIEKRNALHRSLAELGIPVNNTPDRLWYSDYFGMIYV